MHIWEHVYVQTNFCCCQKKYINTTANSHLLLVFEWMSIELQETEHVHSETKPVCPTVVIPACLHSSPVHKGKQGTNLSPISKVKSQARLSIILLENKTIYINRIQK